MNNRTRRMTLTGIMSALSVVLSFVQIPGVPTTSFDSLPGYFIAIFVSPVLGGLIALIGHLVSASINGFFLGVPSHLIIAVSMFISAYVFGLIFKKENKLLIGISVIIATLLNTFLAMPALVLVTAATYGFLATLIIPILIASILNIVLATIIFFALKDFKFDL